MGYDRAGDLETFEVNLQHHPGLTMRVRRPGFAGERAVRKAWPALTDPRAGRDRQESALALAAGALAGALVDWTLEWDGAPVPCTPRALMDLDTEFLLEVVSVWVRRVALRPAGQVEDPDAEPESDADPDPAGDDGGVDEEWLAQLPTVATLPEPVPKPDALDDIGDYIGELEPSTPEATTDTDAQLADTNGAAEVDAEPEVVGA